MTPSPPTDADLQREAATLHRAGHLAEAHAAYARLLSANPDNHEAAYGLALIAVDLGRAAQAVPLLARCLAADPENVPYRIALGLALMGTGQAEDAAGQFLDAANRTPRAT